MRDRTLGLLDHYRSLGLTPPAWAYPLPPSIPFIGHNYGRWGGLLVYASAEVPTKYAKNPASRPEFLQDERVLNRHRAAFEKDYGRFFPRLHIAPINDGSLLVAAQHYLWRAYGEVTEDPRTLLESIAVANFCKFCINDTKNRDYIGDIEKVRVSIPYVRTDLRTLHPATVILPKRAWKHDEVRLAMLEEAPAARFLPLPQFNRFVVNIHLARHATKARRLKDELGGTVLPAWIDQMKGYAKGYPYRFLVEMDEVLSRIAGP